MADKKVAYAPYVKPKTAIPWDAPIWKERERQHRETVIADAYQRCLETVMEFAENWHCNELDKKESYCLSDPITKFPSAPEIRTMVCAAIEFHNEERSLPWPENVMRRIQQDLNHRLITVYKRNIWKAYAAEKRG